MRANESLFSRELNYHISLELLNKDFKYGMLRANF